MRQWGERVGSGDLGIVERRSHSLTVLSMDADMKPSSIGEMSSEMTRPLWPLK